MTITSILCHQYSNILLHFTQKKSHGRTEAAIINEIVERVLLEVNVGTLEVAEYPVGIDAPVADIKSLLSSATTIDGVHWVGIHGMGGVGKTTLAKALYSQMFRTFQGSCFLADVKNVCRIPKGLESLQQQLIDDVLKRKNTVTIRNVDGGINSIRERVCSLKVLVVLDDLDDRKQVHYLVGKFLAGSVIVLTTRNEDLLDALKVKARYPVNKLGDPESWELFTKHAFGDSQIPDEFMEMSTKIISRAGGLPLALTVFGSSLFNLDMDGWRSFFYRLRGIPMDDVANKLIVSFNALNDPILQNVFLDIACFFVGEKKDNVVPILETCYEFINHYISVLKKRCLITINDKNELSMHDLLVEVGRKIARNSFPENTPGKHSRLFAYEDIRDVLKNNKGTEAIEGMFYMGEKRSDNSKYSFDAGTFKRMPNLRFLKLRQANVSGSFAETFENLRLLDWEGCPGLPSDLFAEKLVILQLKSCTSDTIWQRTMVLRNLKFLDMSFSIHLSKTPDFSGLQCLETLRFTWCSKLEEVHSSIGSLMRLVTLDMFRCGNLSSLPDTIGNLRSLESLDISWCSMLNSLPTPLGTMESLIEYKAESLSKLVKLKLSGCYMLKMLPYTICKLRSLEILNISSCQKVEEFACGDSYLSNLQFPSTLKKLYAKDCESLLRLPNLSNLKYLEILKLDFCSSLTEIQGLEDLTSIKQLDLGYCRSLKGLPNISKLEHLEILKLNDCSSLTEIQGLENLTSIKHLNLGDCESLKELPSLSKLRYLETLKLTNCKSLTKIQGLEDLTYERIELQGCDLLTHIT